MTAEAGNPKLEAPPQGGSSKFQAPNSKQIPKTKTQENSKQTARRAAFLRFGVFFPLRFV
jgi:hypothetical protein